LVVFLIHLLASQKNESGEDMIESVDQLVNRYLDAKDYVIDKGYSWEIDWQNNQDYEKITESDFIRESAWVILSSGFKETIVRKLFPLISNCFLDWGSPHAIVSSLNDCKKNALKVFKNVKKINAICGIITFVNSEDFSIVKKEIKLKGIEYLKQLPYIGPITGLHLLKNLGLQLIKPDRHLVRIAKSAGFTSPKDLGEVIKEAVGDSLSEIDIVLWRYSTLNKEYTQLFS
jgi:hypothetical protein